MKVLAVVDSESFLKWAASLLHRIHGGGSHVTSRLAIITGPLHPTQGQVDAALAGLPTVDYATVNRGQLMREVRDNPPDLVLVAATGPVAEMIALSIIAASGERRPVFVTGSPGLAIPVAQQGVNWRAQWTDAHIVHSPQEVDAYRHAFHLAHASPDLWLTQLPFLQAAGGVGAENSGHSDEPNHTRDSAPIAQVVFAPQSVIPHAKPDRLKILAGLAHLSTQGYRVVVKLRTAAGEQQTHYEALPYDRLWDQEHQHMGFGKEALSFATGPMSQWLTPGSALVTLSSTAALEALAARIPTVLISDFGVSPQLANVVFSDSGCLVELADIGQLLRNGGPEPSADWMQASYFHNHSIDLYATSHTLVAAAQAGRLAERKQAQPVNRPIFWYSILKSRFPFIWSPAKLVRSVLGRLTKLH